MPLPTSLPWMESVDAKMDRAREHIETLGREINDYLSSIKVTLYLKTSPNVPNPWMVFHGTDSIAPMRITAILGDAVHNMRAALDNLVCGLAKTTDHSCNCKKTAFPYRQDEAGWSVAVKSELDGVPEAAKEIMKSLQPWLNPSSPLLLLNNLSNIDKHRHCNVALAYSRDTMFLVYCADGRIVEVTVPGPVYLGDVQTIPLPIASANVMPGARIQTAGTLVLTFREPGQLTDTPIPRVLQDCFDYVEQNVIAPLKPFFEPTFVISVLS